MSYYVIVRKDGSIRIYKNRQDREPLPKGSRQFVCSSNVTVQDLYCWIDNGCNDLRTIKAI